MSAQQLLDNKYFMDLIEALKMDIFNQWQSARSVEHREKLYHDKGAIETLNATILNQARDDANRNSD